MSESKSTNYCIIMAGGPGSRFWPLSTEEYPKQFIDLVGVGESMIQRTFRRCEQICPRENIVIVSSERYGDLMHQQIPGLADYQVLCEPSRRNTAPCIAFAAAVIKRRCPEATIFVTPSDHFISGWDAYVDDVRQAVEVARQQGWIVTIGAQPSNPNTKYGYIQFDEALTTAKANNLHKVLTFTEKPPYEVARHFIESGEFYWNVGVFAWRLDVLEAAYRRFLPAIAEAFTGLSERTPREEIERIYSICENISVDHGIIEKADNVYGLKANFGWSDVETWDALYNTCDHDRNGNAFISGNVFAYDVKDCVVHVPQGKTIVLQGLDGFVITERDNTIMICRRDQEERHVKFMSDVELERMNK